MSTWKPGDNCKGEPSDTYSHSKSTRIQYARRGLSGTNIGLDFHLNLMHGEKEGATLIVKGPTSRFCAEYENTLGLYYLRYYSEWHSWIKNNWREQIDPHQFILVTGADFAACWTTAVFMSHEARFGLISSVTAANLLGLSTRTQVESSRKITIPTNHGPADRLKDGKVDFKEKADGHVADQCVYVKGWKVARRWRISKMEAAAGPHNLEKADPPEDIGRVRASEDSQFIDDSYSLDSTMTSISFSVSSLRVVFFYQYILTLNSISICTFLNEFSTFYSRHVITSGKEIE